MSDPERLSAASDSEFERAVLRAGRVTAPPGSKERALMVASNALRASAVVSGAAATGKGSALGMAKAGSLAKLVGIVGVAGMGVTASAVVFHEMHEVRPAYVALSGPPTAHAAPIRQVHAKAEAIVPTDEGWTPAPIDPLTIASTPADVVPGPPALAQVPAVVADAGEAAASTVPGELTMLELAREALLAGDPAGCLSILDRYGEQFPRGSMGPEGMMLRIEALMKAGDAPAARQVGDAFLASDPDSPYGARVRSLLRVSDP